MCFSSPVPASLPSWPAVCWVIRSIAHRRQYKRLAMASASVSRVVSSSVTVTGWRHWRHGVVMVIGLN